VLYQSICSTLFGFVTHNLRACRQSDGWTDRQNYDSQDHPSTDAHAVKTQFIPVPILLPIKIKRHVLGEYSPACFHMIYWVALLVGHWTCDLQVVGSSPGRAPSSTGLGQTTYTSVPLSHAVYALFYLPNFVTVKIFCVV